jgi:hypothetical protein
VKNYKKYFELIISSLRSVLSSKWAVFIKITIGVTILFLFFHSIDISKLSIIIKNFGIKELLFICFLVVVRNIIASIRFKILLNKQNNIPIKTIFIHYFIGAFYNNFLPSSLGGDAIRVLLLNKEGVSKTNSFLLIATERTIGFYALILIASFSIFLWQLPKNWSALIFISFLGFTLFLGLLSFVKVKSKNSIFNKFGTFVSMIRNQPKTIMNCLILSLLFQIIGVYISYYISKTIDANGSIFHYMTIVPMVWVFTMLPISFGGLGLREISFTYLLSFIAVSAEEAAMISIGTYFTMIFSGVIGLLFLIKKLKYLNEIRKNKSKNIIECL